ATHARRHRVEDEKPALVRKTASRPRIRPSATTPSVTRKVDSSGNVCFAGSNYRVGNAYRRRQVQVAVVGDTVEIFVGQELIRVHPVKHDPARQHGALANPGGRPNRINAANP
ncbi:MAG: IS481 family transposase, partial [Actinomycetota bacterium]|nr:IS481 family transposase [Actinomycetota bacterium]